MQILLVEDHELTARSIRLSLGRHQLTHALNCASARAALSRSSYDVMVLDLRLPDGSGMGLCAELDEQSPQLSVIVVSANNDLQTKLRAFESGADDYLVKPFATPELIARLHAVVRRRQPQQTLENFSLGEFLFSPSAQLMSSSSSTFYLTAVESEILRKLIQHKGQVVAKHQLLEAAEFNQNTSNCLEAHIKNLRKKLHKYPDLIKTVYGLGYRLNPSYAKTITS